jgi:hypothetical protein
MRRTRRTRRRKRRREGISLRADLIGWLLGMEE